MEQIPEARAHNKFWTNLINFPNRIRWQPFAVNHSR